MTAPKHTSQSHILIARARAEAIIQLRLYGIHVSGIATTDQVVGAIGRTGLQRRDAETTLAYLKRFVDIPTGRSFVPARTAPEFRPMVWKPHPRQAEIEALPHPVSMGGVGNEDNRIRREY